MLKLKWGLASVLDYAALNYMCNTVQATEGYACLPWALMILNWTSYGTLSVVYDAQNIIKIIISLQYISRTEKKKCLTSFKTLWPHIFFDRNDLRNEVAKIPTKSDHFLAIKKSMSWKKRKRLKGTILVWSSICKMTRIWNITIYFLCPLHKWDLYVPILWKCNFLKYFSISEGLDKVMSSNLWRVWSFFSKCDLIRKLFPINNLRIVTWVIRDSMAIIQARRETRISMMDESWFESSPIFFHWWKFQNDSFSSPVLLVSLETNYP